MHKLPALLSPGLLLIGSQMGYAHSIALANTSTRANAYQWFENGSYLTNTQNIRVSFDTVGAYEISLIAFNGACRDTASVILTASAPGSVSASLTHPSCPGLENGLYWIRIEGKNGQFAKAIIKQ